MLLIRVTKKNNTHECVGVTFQMSGSFVISHVEGVILHLRIACLQLYTSDKTNFVKFVIVH